jgi:hypothetical protein
MSRLQSSFERDFHIQFPRSLHTELFFYPGYPLRYGRSLPNPNVQLKCDFSLRLSPLPTYPQVLTTLSTDEKLSRQPGPLLSAPPTTFQTQDLSPSQTTRLTVSNVLQHQRRSLELVRPAETLRRVTRNSRIPNRLTLTHTVSTIPPFLHVLTPYISLPPFVSKTAPTRLPPMYLSPIVPLSISDPIPSFTQSFLTATNPGYDDTDLILPQSLHIMASIVLQVLVYAPQMYLQVCWSTFCAIFNQGLQDMPHEKSINCAEHLMHSKSIVFPAPIFKKDFNAITFPAPHHVTLSCLSPLEKYTHTFDTDITAYPITIHYPPHLQDMEPTPYIQEYQEEEDIQILLQDQFVYEDDDDYIFIPDEDTPFNPDTFTAYKRVDKKIHPISTQMPLEYQIKHKILTDPLDTLPPLPTHPPEFIPTPKITEERMKILNVNSTGFLWPEEEKLFQHVMILNEDGIAFEDVERGTLKEEFFSPYIIPTVPHSPWEYRNIPIPPGIMPQVIKVLKLKMAAGVYEQSQSSYRSRWFVVLKKSGKLRIVHDLQPLNGVTIRDAGMLPIVDDFVEGFAGRQCYTVFDLFWGFDARKIHPKSRDFTAFMTPLGLLQITSLPTGFTNSPAEFQKCMVIVLQDEIPHAANIFIDDLPIKGSKTQYIDVRGQPEVLSDNPGIRRFIWEHAQDVHRILHRVQHAGATVSVHKAQISLPEVLIVGQKCNSKGREPDRDKVSKILDWPPLTNPKEVCRFLGLCGTVRIWIPNYSQIVQPLTELYHKNKDFVWDERRQTAFDKIKQLVSSAPALHPIDYLSERPVILSVDSS